MLYRVFLCIHSVDGCWGFSTLRLLWTMQTFQYKYFDTHMFLPLLDIYLLVESLSWGQIYVSMLTDVCQTFPKWLCLFILSTSLWVPVAAHDHQHLVCAKFCCSCTVRAPTVVLMSISLMTNRVEHLINF